jgi:hypothetical protein
MRDHEQWRVDTGQDHKLTKGKNPRRSQASISKMRTDEKTPKNV